ncbi:ribosome assembly factor SBDS [Candidatus Bathyarchaeota archaeon]|nr:MAG: ribosome assembly factor SBDS [Candidatus Bathyarchaeota archaeon]
MSGRYTIARISMGGENFEILVKPEPAYAYRSGKDVPISDVLVSDVIFSDANKGLKASTEKLRRSFGTTDTLRIAEMILKRGTLLLTAEQRRKMIEEKRKQIISFISRQCIDPRTKLPHPPLRIEQAMKEIHYSIDPFKSAEEQANEVIKLLRRVIPIKIEKLTVGVKVPPEHVGRAYGVVKSFGTIKREEWQRDGGWIALVELPAGLYGSFLERLGEITKGRVETKLIE